MSLKPASREFLTRTCSIHEIAAWRRFERDGVRLACRDFGGEGPPPVLLHGLAGHAGEWAETAAWLSVRCRVVALDLRGHGRSDASRPHASSHLDRPAEWRAAVEDFVQRLSR